MSAIAARLTPSPQLRSFVLIGLACTGAYALLYTVLRHGGMDAIAANAVALTATMGANFAANRHYSFRASGGRLAKSSTDSTLVPAASRIARWMKPSA